MCLNLFPGVLLQLALALGATVVADDPKCLSATCSFLQDTLEKLSGYEAESTYECIKDAVLDLMCDLQLSADGEFSKIDAQLQLELILHRSSWKPTREFVFPLLVQVKKLSSTCWRFRRYPWFQNCLQRWPISNLHSPSLFRILRNKEPPLAFLLHPSVDLIWKEFL